MAYQSILTKKARGIYLSIAFSKLIIICSDSALLVYIYKKYALLSRHTQCPTLH
jgi:hypothetical protein